MVSLHTLPLLFLLSASQARAAALHPQVRSDGIKWGPCNLTTELPVQCAKLPVPLDYSNSSSDKMLELDLIKVPAAKQPSKGSILLNFGGPGQDGLTSMLSYAPIQMPITGGEHDLVSWDPRGTGKTLRFDCFPADPTGLLGNILASGLATSSDSSIGQIWAEAKLLSDTCYAQLREVGGLVGMPFVARDMMQIVDALNEDGMLRYWGISGGTTLGATAAALFPDRMDRVVLDGVINSHQYYNSYETEMFASTDDTFREFLKACAATPERCPLARNNRTCADLEKVMEDLFETLKYNPIAFNGTLITYTSVKTQVVSTLYRPKAYQTLSIQLDSLIEGDYATYTKLTQAAAGIPVQAQAVLGIRCGDKTARASKLSELEPVVDKFLETSKWFGDFALGQYTLTCAQWQFEAKERYLGDFQVKTKNPILFVGNTFDPVTPLVSARNMSSGFEGSVVLQHNGHGHISFVQPSACTNKTMQNYFLHGTLPKAGTVCEPDQPLFSATTT